MADLGLKERLLEELSGYNIWIILGSLVLVTITSLIIFYFTATKIKQKVLPSPSSSKPRYRFRKREKIAFYGTKMLRKVKSFTKNTIKEVGPPGRKMKKRELVFRLQNVAKRILRLKKESRPLLKPVEPPQSVLEANIDRQDSETQLPPEVLHILKSVRVFGHFDKPIFLEICKHMESCFVASGDYLFKRGDPDESIYVVQSGRLSVYIYEDNNDFHVKDVSPGESIHSLLSVLDVLTGHESPYKTVSAKAVVDSTVMRLPIKAFNEIFELYPQSLVRIVQVIMVRCQRVTFMALHNYLGLSHELINPRNLTDMKFSLHHISGKGSPTKSTRASVSDGHIETVTKVTTPESENVTAPIPVTTPRKRSDETDYSSDFDAVLDRARLDGSSVGSPTSSKILADGLSQSFCGRQRKKVVTSMSNEESHSEMTENYILECCTADIAKLFGLEDEALLEGRLHLRTVASGTLIIRQGDQDADLVFVVQGTLQVMQDIVGKESGETSLFIVHPGEMVGSLAVLTGEPSFFSIWARTKATLVMMAKEDFYSIMIDYPRIVLNVAHSFSKRMSPFVRQIDFALDWVHIEAARAVFMQDEAADSLYIILNGRLRLVTSQNGKKELTGEYGRGELVGLVEVLTMTERTSTCFAVRDTEVAKLPANLLNHVKRKYPRIVTRLIHLLGKKILGSNKKTQDNLHSLPESSLCDQRPMVSNVATVAIVPISSDVPIANFTMELKHALNSIGPSLRLTSEIVVNRLGVNALDSVNEYRLAGWLAQQEDIHKIVLYECDFKITPWTHRCIRQADCILIVGLADRDPTIGLIEQQLENVAVRAQKELILLHNEEGTTPRHAADWLNIRGWVSSNHHIRCPKRVFSKRSKAKMLEIYERLSQSTADHLSDFSRLARFLTGTSVGLVLGGGGARGIAHLGIMKVMQENGIPIDLVGGTSIGAFVGALWCESTNMTTFIQKGREFSMDMNKLWKKLLDLTYPMTSMFTGRGFNKAIEDVLLDRQIEDLWIPYFTVTTDISSSKMRIHRTGSLWRYVRSSMSLAGYLPPMCDPMDGNLLLDGGYVNNLPADVMKGMGARTIFAIDVGSSDETNLENYGDHLSGWWLLWKRWNPWASNVKVPTMSDIQSRLAYVSCVRQMEQVIKHGICQYIRPPVEKYGTLQFGAFDEILAVGYKHGKEYFSTLVKNSELDDILSTRASQENLSKSTIKMANVSFTDLAELVSQINDPSYVLSVSDIEEEEADNDNEDDDADLVTVTMSDPHVGVKNPRLKPKLTSPTGHHPPRRRRTIADFSRRSDNETLEQ